MQNFLEKLRKIKLSPDTYKLLPESAGVYVFFKDKEVIYIGKAINLKRRVSSYFDLDLIGKTARMISEANYLAFIQVTSELESLLLEAKLIRIYMPRFNVAAKDDKHPLYILITKEKYPRVITARKSDINAGISYGPFPSSTNVRMVLRWIRRIFPYSDHKIGKRGCLYSNIGLCNPCPNLIELANDNSQKQDLRKEYLKNIKKIKAVLDGNINKVLNDLQKEMKELSADQKFEEAKIIRDKIKQIEYITQPQIPSEFFMENPNLYEDVRQKELNNLQRILMENGKRKMGNLVRVECYDIAHLAGSNPTASMVTFINGEADKKYYRHFRIRQLKGNSDTDSLREVIKRRLNHLKDWGKPDLIIVDGGKPQVGVFTHELSDTDIPVVGLAKRFETLVIPTHELGSITLKEYRLPKGPALNLVQRLRDEAHRFARRYHHKLISAEITRRFD